MNGSTKRRLIRAWYDELKSVDTRPVPRGPLPHLGIGAGVVTILVSSFFAARLADAFALIVAYGPHAYFREGLYIVDWKHDVLSTGGSLSLTGRLVQVPTTLLLITMAVAGADLCSMLIQRVNAKKGRWVGRTLRLIGGAALVAFAVYLYRQGGWGLHPIPLSALIGGVVLIWRAFRLSFQGIDPHRT